MPARNALTINLEVTSWPPVDGIIGRARLGLAKLLMRLASALMRTRIETRIVED